MNKSYTNPNTGAKYKVEEFLGQGSFCNVWKGKDPKQQDVALKVSQKLITEAQRREYETQVSKELEIMSKLNHPNILKCYDGFYDATHKQFILVLEYMPGGNLTDFIVKAIDNKDQDFTSSERKEIVKQLTHALHIMHSQNILHRDIKGENILLDTNKNLKVADLGIAIKTIMTKASTKSGTYQFLAPESMSEGDKNEFLKQSDLYQLGLVFHFLYFKEYICEGIQNYFELCKKDEDTFDATMKQYFSQKNSDQKYPNEVKVILGLLKKDPKKRISLKNIDEILELKIDWDKDNDFISKLPWQYQEEIYQLQKVNQELSEKLKEAEEMNKKLIHSEFQLSEQNTKLQKQLDSSVQKHTKEISDIIESKNEQKVFYESLIEEQKIAIVELKKQIDKMGKEIPKETNLKLAPKIEQIPLQQHQTKVELNVNRGYMLTEFYSIIKVLQIC